MAFDFNHCNNQPWLKGYFIKLLIISVGGQKSTDIFEVRILPTSKWKWSYLVLKWKQSYMRPMIQR